jgi:hypothetical protein
MSKIIFEDIEIPKTCGECRHIGHYESGPWARNPHCCCELIWRLTEEDYKVDKNSIDKNCPLKVGYIEV